MFAVIKNMLKRTSPLLPGLGRKGEGWASFSLWWPNGLAAEPTSSCSMALALRRAVLLTMVSSPSSRCPGCRWCSFPSPCVGVRPAQGQRLVQGRPVVETRAGGRTLG